MDKTQNTPLALKYRPQHFNDLRGQEMLVRTIMSSIKNSRIAHAYLLTGIRGVGKTTSARIIASVLNCENPVITGEIKACKTCNNCISFSKQSHPDIIEIDAASKTGVDDVRAIIESTEYRPILGKYKIFIIDEVHMMSKSAFNAMLKTLEEPPQSAIFIFATTEVNKIPITIISRCQRFDLKRLKTEDIITLLSSIANNENIKFDKDAIQIIAQKSGGSARDAISMIDQAWVLALSLESRTITKELVMSMLCLTGSDVVINFVKQIAEQNTQTALEIINEININSNDLVHFFENVLDIIGYLTKKIAAPRFIDPNYEIFANELEQIIEKFNISSLTIIWQLIFIHIDELKKSYNQILSTEMLVIKIIYSSLLPSPKAIAEEISRITPRR